MRIEVSTYINTFLPTVDAEGNNVDAIVPELWTAVYHLGGTQAVVTGSNGIERAIPFETNDNEPIGVVRDRLVQVVDDVMMLKPE